MNRLEKNFQYKITIITVILTIGIPIGWDWVKNKPIFSTLWDSIKWIWKNVFEYELKIYQILIIALVIGLTIVIKNNFLKRKVDFRDYTTDAIKSIMWKWEWKKNMQNGLWDITRLAPLCSKCGMKTLLITHSGGFSGTTECPRCDLHMKNIEDPKKIEFIIHENIKEKLHLKKIRKIE